MRSGGKVFSVFSLGIFVMHPEFTFNNILVRRQDPVVKRRADSCMEKYFVRGWREVEWTGQPGDR